MKTFKQFDETKLDDKLDKLVSNEIKKRKLAKFPVNATDDIKMRMKPNKPDRLVPLSIRYPLKDFIYPLTDN